MQTFVNNAAIWMKATSLEFFYHTFKMNTYVGKLWLEYINYFSKFLKVNSKGLVLKLRSPVNSVLLT